MKILLALVSGSLVGIVTYFVALTDNIPATLGYIAFLVVYFSEKNK